MERSYTLISVKRGGNPRTTVTYYAGTTAVAQTDRYLRSAAQRLGQKWVAMGTTPSYGTTQLRGK